MELHPEIWWYLTRASGLTAWFAGLGSLLAGLALATRTLGDRPRGPWLLDLHRGLAGVTVAFTGLHVVALVADSWIHFGWADVLVPFASGWEPAAVAGGVVAMWLHLAVEVSSLLRSRIPKEWWRTIHLTSYGAAVSATIHAFTAGTDAGHPGVVLAAVVALVASAFMAAYRVFAPKKPARVLPPRPSRTTPEAAGTGM